MTDYEYIVLKKKRLDDGEGGGIDLDYQHIGDTWEDVEMQIDNGELAVGDIIYKCEPIAEVSGRLKRIEKIKSNI